MQVLIYYIGRNRQNKRILELELYQWILQGVEQAKSINPRSSVIYNMLVCNQ